MPLMSSEQSVTHSNLFAYGFRSNFLLAGIAAMLFVPLWALSFVTGTPLGSSWSPMLWHAHEMLFGFIASSALCPAVLIAAVDLAFLPALAVLVARPLLRSRSRNTPLLAVLALFWL